MILEDIQDYKVKLWLYINAVYLGAALLFVPVLLINGPLNMMFPLVVALVYFSAVIFGLQKNGDYLWQGRGTILIVPGVLLASIYLNPQYGIYWAFVGVVSLFFMLELFDASLTTIAVTAAAIYLLEAHYSDATLYRFYATLSLVGFFSFWFAYLIDKLLATLDTLATQDPLTKARNRHTFNKSINEALTQSRRYGTTTALFIFDLDHFKAFNDTHGHLVGDDVLRHVAGVVHERLRETDLFFRYGGEEFAILMRHTPLQSAAHVADELRELIAATPFDADLAVTISGGISEVQKNDDATTWVERCDTALYEAKAAGRNVVRIGIPPLFESWNAETQVAQ